MCLILFAFDQHPKYKLIFAANRDEFYDRPTLAAHHWNDYPDIYGGRDIKSGGTWLAMKSNGKFIAITNYRDLKFIKKDAITRGKLSLSFLSGTMGIHDFVDHISKERHLYNGYNLLLSDDGFDNLYHYSNINNQTTKIEKGIHGLSNHLLDTNWPKVATGKSEIARLLQKDTIEVNEISEILKNDQIAADELLPNTGISFELEKKLSPVFISMNGYGTRCSTVLLLDRDHNLAFHELTYNEKKQLISEKNHKMKIK